MEPTNLKTTQEYLVVEKRKPRVFTDLDPEFFWAWTDFPRLLTSWQFLPLTPSFLPSYVEFIMLVAVLASILMFFLIDFSPFVETVGFLAVFTEACLGVPQFYRNFKNRSVSLPEGNFQRTIVLFVRSTYGMSLQMVIMWTCGDVFKTSYFYLRNTPPQFFICGALQVEDCVKIDRIYSTTSQPQRWLWISAFWRKSGSTGKTLRRENAQKDWLCDRGLR